MKRRWMLAPLGLILLYVVVRCAWIADDAFITFRASDNLIHGLGPRWNTFERVQAFTTPLWMLVVALFAGITGELIKTVAAVQIGLTLATAWLIARHARTPASAAVALAILCLSRAFADFSSAGMENPLAHLLVVWFAIETLRGGRVLVRSLLASLLLCTRLDFVWLVAPAMLDVVFRAPRSVRKTIAIGMAPILLWEAFAFLYFGSFLPNSARAKLTTGVPLSRLAEQGAEYFFDSLRVDPLTLVAMFVAIAMTMLGTNRRARTLSLGLVLALGYVLVVGGDFMSGRFFTVPLALAAVLVADMRAFCTRRGALVGSAGAVGLSALVGLPSLTDSFQKWPDIERTVVDCRLAFHPFTGLTTGMLPAYIEYGLKLRTTPGVTVQPGIGIAGYYAGPTVKILDAFALADPLRSRFPIPDPRNESFLKMGHLMRPIPDGYIASMETGENRIGDPSVRAYWEIVAKVTQAPVLDLDRIFTSVKLELGLYDDLLDGYFATYDEKPIPARELVHPPGLDPHCYTWWRPCADEGIAFTETGLRVEIGLQLRPSKVVFDATPDDYWVIFRLGGKEQRRAFAPREQQIVEVGDDAVDAIVFMPRTGRGVRTMKGVVAVP